MKRSQSPNPFELENLEPRVLLSGDPILGIGVAAVSDEPDFLDTGLDKPPIEESLKPDQTGLQNTLEQQSTIYDPSQNLTDIFAGLSEEDPFADQTAQDPLPPSLTSQSITEEGETAIVQGLGQLAALGNLLVDLDAFGELLPLTKNATLGRLLSPYEILDSRLSRPVYDYFTDATDPPTTDGLLLALYKIPNTADLSITINTLSGGYNGISDEIRFDVDLKATRTGEVCLDPRELGFEFAEDVEAGYVADFIVDFSFGLSGDDLNNFFLEIDELSADLVIKSEDIHSSATMTAYGNLPVIVDGAMDLRATISIALDESITGDSRISLEEIEGIGPENISDLVHLVSIGSLTAEFIMTISSEPESSDLVFLPVHIDVTGEDLFSGISPIVTTKVDISSLKDSLLDLTRGLRQLGEESAAFAQLNDSLPVIDASINQIIADESGTDPGQFFDLHTPALEYFTLLDVFNFDINAYRSEIGNLPGIQVENFDISDVDHILKLRNLLEQEQGVTLTPDWDFSLYLPEIWSLFNPDFQINEYLPNFQALLGLPYVPVMNDIRSDMKSYFGAFPNLKGLLDYISATGLKSVFNGFSSELSSDPFVLNGEYDTVTGELGIDLLADA
ncbi:MAG: LEPR-XLL domain-containing protein, partial [Deltaproteobacteria bacterium]|nr:LEPR-XLL domain-containing protein [Deltaproteobacteria bacterium]